MLVEEHLLAEFRDEDGLCRLKPHFGGPYRYADDAKRVRVWCAAVLCVAA